MIYPIVIYGNPTLRKASVNIDASYPDFKKLVDDMWITLGEASGVGLAAPQIGKNIRLFIVDCTPWAEENPELAEGFADDNPLANSASYKVTLNDVSMQDVFVDFVEDLVLFENGKIFAAKRGESPYPYVAHKYEFPGGKIEKGERGEDAVKRELKVKKEFFGGK